MTVSPFLLVFPNGHVGRGTSSCTMANWQPSTGSLPFPLDLELLSHALPPSSICLHPSFYHCSIVFSMEGTGRKRPRYSCPDLKDDMVEQIIDRCDIISSASMAGSFKTILDSTNNIITRNPSVKERFDLPYLLRCDPDDWRGDDGGLALCKLMPLDNDAYDVKMPSLEGKDLACANGDWVVYIGYNCEWELVNAYTRHWVPLQKISADCLEVEHTGILRTFK